MPVLSKKMRMYAAAHQKQTAPLSMPALMPPPGTLKAQLNVEGNSMMDKLAEELDFPFKRNGSLVICTEPSNLEGLEKLYDKGQKTMFPVQRS